MPQSTVGQSSVIDSLRTRLLQTEGEDRIRTLIGLSYNFLRISGDSSLVYAEHALDYSEQTDNERGVARALLMQGNTYNMLGENSKALTTHSKSLKIFIQLEDSSAIGITYNSLGADYHNLGQYREAIEQYKNSSEIARNLKNNEGICTSTNNIGIIYEDWKKYDLALEYYRHALAIAQDLNDKSYIGITLQNIGVAYQKLGNYNKALSFLEQSLEVSREIGDKKGIYNTYLNKGVIYEELNDFDKAILNYEKALEISIESGNKKNIADASLKLGTIYCGKSEFTKAYPLLNNALTLAKEINEVILIKEAYKSLSDFYKRRNDFEKAFINFVEFTAIKDTIFNRDSRKEISEMQTLYEVDKKEKEIEIQDLKIDQQQSRFYYIIIGIGFLIILTILFFSRYRLKQNHMRLKLERKNIDIEQRLLRTQMNPHFIFNSLNSISSFISDNNSDSAQSYLSKFARLMRYILENSRKTMIPLEDEINTLTLNLELEQLRHNHRFDYVIEVDDKLDPEFTYVPPMLIQPFIENAIIHGLAGKAGQGMIKLEFRVNGELMHCTLEDNGIGRERAMKNKQSSETKKHISLGMQVTQERLSILNEKTIEEVSVTIIDLKSDDGEAIGTKIELHIPYETE